jgi:hypothetical protein
MSTLTLSYILLVRPHQGGPQEGRQGVWVEAVNEGAVMCAGIHLVVFGGLVGEAEVLWAAGWSLVGVLILNLQAALRSSIQGQVLGRARHT